MADDEVRSAGKRTPDRLAAGLDSKGIATAAKEIGSTHRVYVKEWLWEARFNSAEEAEEFSVTKFGGRLLEEDMQVVLDFDGSFILMTRLWNVHSEWKYMEMAQDIADSIVRLTSVSGERADVKVVARNSREEHLLSQYGVLKMAIR